MEQVYAIILRGALMVIRMLCQNELREYSAIEVDKAEMRRVRNDKEDLAKENDELKKQIQELRIHACKPKPELAVNTPTAPIFGMACRPNQSKAFS